MGKYDKKVEVKLFTDSESTLESIASSKPVETKRLRNQVQEFKEVLVNKKVKSYAWLSSRDMIADSLTKEMKMTKDLEDLMLRNVFKLSSINEVKASSDELKMSNIRNRKLTLTEASQTEQAGE